MKQLKFLKEKVKFVKLETLKIAQNYKEIRLASSLSPIEILSALYYGGILNYDAANPLSDKRDRFIISKGHGSICFYPILADLGFFSIESLKEVGKKGSFLGSIPDPLINGYESINGSLGHGLGLASGIALALKQQKKPQNVVVLSGDGELQEGANWEAIAFGAQSGLDNLTLIVDSNKIQMLDYCKNIIDLNPLHKKFEAFGWDCFIIKNGHNIKEVYKTLKSAIPQRHKKPKIIIANTIKGKGIRTLETNSLCHILSVDSKEIAEAIEELEND